MERGIKLVGGKSSEPRRTNKALAAEIDVLILHLHRPIAREHMFQTAPNDESDLRVIPSLKCSGCSRSAEARVDIAIGETASRIDESSVKCVSDATAYSAEPVYVYSVSFKERLRTNSGVAAPDVGTLNICFNPKQQAAPAARLPI